MGEIMRWRLTRAPQRRVPSDQGLLQLDSAPHNVRSHTKKILKTITKTKGKKSTPKKVVSPYLAYLGILQNPNDLRLHLTTGHPQGPTSNATPASEAAANALLKLDEWLAANAPVSASNLPYTQPAVADLQQQIADLLGLYPPNSTDWKILCQSLSELLYAGLILSAMEGGLVSLVDSLGLLTRWLLITGLVNDALEAHGPINTPGDIYAALRWRTIVLPDSIVTLLASIRANKGAILVRQPGFADLYITREEWDHYEPAEIASIENILAGENKTRIHVLVNQAKTTTTTDETTTTVTEQDTTTTDQSQLQTQSSSNISLAAHVDGQVDVSAQYGTAQINAHVGGSLDYSNASATSKATTQSHETVARAVSKFEQTTRQVRTTSNLTRSTDKEEHSFNNTGQPSPVVGIYRWVDQIQNVELDRYPHRFLMEFEIPEPGAWTRWVQQKNAGKNMIHQLPAPLTTDGNPVTTANPIVQAYQLSGAPGFPNYYGEFVARYAAQGVDPPPTPTVAVALNLEFPAPGTAVVDAVNWVNKSASTLEVPAGYIAQTWQASVISIQPADPGSDLWIAVGQGAAAHATNLMGTTILNGGAGAQLRNVA